MTEANNAAPAPAVQQVYTDKLVPTETSFFFKKDDAGFKRETVKLQLPYLSIEGLFEILSAPENEKIRALVLNTVNEELIYGAARQQVGADSNPVDKQEQLDLSKLSLLYISELPPAERRGGGIAKEIWEAFAKDYTAIMPGLTNKTAEQVSNAVKILLAKFQPIKTQKKILNFMKEQLAIYAANTTELEQFAQCVEFLNTKADAFLSMDEAALLANL